jgi:hypothetical protein
MFTLHKKKEAAPSVVGVGLLNRPQRDWKLVIALSSLGLSSVTLLLILFQGALINQLASKPVPILVETQDGQPIRVAPIDHTDRSPETIRHFTTTTLTLLMNWSGFLPPETLADVSKPRVDAGYALDGRYKVTTAAWQGSFALSDDFRREFLDRLASLTPMDVFSGGSQTVLTITHVSEPQKIADGRWKVDVVANLSVFRRNDAGTTISFNKSVFVRSVDPPAVLAGASPLERQIYAIRQAGLEIYAIRDLERGNL